MKKNNILHIIGKKEILFNDYFIYHKINKVTKSLVRITYYWKKTKFYSIITLFIAYKNKMLEVV